MKTAFMLAIFSTTLLALVHGHGYIIDPPGRASRWRKGFPGPPNYDDNGLNCGGWSKQWQVHGGKCGVCGDEYGIANPKFVYPGVWANNPPIVETYQAGQIITVKVKITAAHKGYFTFRVSPLTSAPITQLQLDQHVLMLPTGEDRWVLGDRPAAEYTMKLRLPTGLRCAHCVMQWWYTTANNWMGERPESFVNCADIKIV